MTEPEGAQRSNAEIKATLERQGFMKLVGAEVDEIGNGFCKLSLRYRPEVAQHDGLFHGGAVAFLVDNAAAAAAATVVPVAAIILTAEFKLNLFSPGRGDRLECRAEVLKPGRTLCVVQVQVFICKGAEKKPMAAALATIACVQPDKDGQSPGR